MTRVELLNPLPGALAHYELALADLLGACGCEAEVLPTTVIEQPSGAGRRRRLETLARALRERLLRSPPAPGSHRLVLWPALGYPELLLWRGAAARTTVVVHDPTPLRSQVGLDDRTAAGVRRLGRLRPLRRMLVHSSAALDAVHRRGYDAALAPLPLLTPRSAWRPGDRVVVLGQHKPARDLDVLGGIGAGLAERGLRPTIVGRGWPAVRGWEVREGFVPEPEFEQWLGEAAVVLLPYAKVYQSDVAVRAAELGVPVVGPATTNVADLYGVDWPGLVRGTGVTDWLQAVGRTLPVAADDVLRRVGDYRTEACTSWASWAASIARSSASR